MFKIFLLAGVLAASVASAQAAPKCPSGQFYRVTKKVCVDKAAAVRDGLLNNRQPVTRRAEAAKKSRAERRRLSQSSQAHAKQASPQDSATLEERSGVNQNTFSQAAKHDSGVSIVSPSGVQQSPKFVPAIYPSSPFGALTDPWTSGLTSTLSLYRFSFPLTYEN